MNIYTTSSMICYAKINGLVAICYYCLYMKKKGNEAQFITNSTVEKHIEAAKKEVVKV